ncbi:MAG: lytic murein transglycosylase B [Leptothrix sp. (in: Bacteria)]|nr:lytic murein transglycosylase B [Leptothrix sp. (in: b-proteobacteria)]
MPFVPSTRRRLLALATLSALSAWPAVAAPAQRKRRAAPPPGPSYAHHPAAAAFAASLAARRSLDGEWVLAQLAQARRNDSVRKLVMPPPAGTAKNWAAYRSRFVEPQRIAAGIDFWREHERWLAEAEARWGVPPQIVVAIIGVETYYGRITGSFRLVDALATLSFDFPAGRRDRSDFFRSELEEFFVLCERQGLDPQAVKGSYAGALGLPQFMPGSVNRWAVDFDGDGHVDLMGNGADAVGSVAHYLAVFGWRRGLATHHAVSVPVDGGDRAALLAPDILPSFTAAQFGERGAELDAAGRAHDGLLALVELHNAAQAPSYVAGTTNFYAITRYNWSSYYAMAVIDLAQALRAAR